MLLCIYDDAYDLNVLCLIFVGDCFSGLWNCDYGCAYSHEFFVAHWNVMGVSYMLCLLSGFG